MSNEGRDLSGAPVFEIDVRDNHGESVVTVVGEFDAAAVASLEVELDWVAPEPARLDLTGVTFIDSTALTFLVRRQKTIALLTVSGAVDRLIRMCGLETELVYAVGAPTPE